MRGLLLTLTFALILAPGLAADDKETATYEGHGLTFRHPKDWKATVEQKGGILTINVQQDKGPQAMIQVYPALVTSKQVLGQMDKAFRKAFEGKLVKDSDKAVKRKLAGAEREGLAMAFDVAKGVTVNFEVFAFETPSKKRTLAVVFQHIPPHADAAKKGFGMIADSLREGKPR
jgi:hypothetical protein